MIKRYDPDIEGSYGLNRAVMREEPNGDYVKFADLPASLKGLAMKRVIETTPDADCEAGAPIEISDLEREHQELRLQDERDYRAKINHQKELVKALQNALDEISALASIETDTGPVFNRRFLDDDAKFERFMEILGSRCR